MAIERLNNKYFWGAATIILLILSHFIIDPFFKELIDTGLVVSITALIMKTFGIEQWRGGSCFSSNSLIKR